MTDEVTQDNQDELDDAMFDEMAKAIDGGEDIPADSSDEDAQNEGDDSQEEDSQDDGEPDNDEGSEPDESGEQDEPAVDPLKVAQQEIEQWKHKYNSDLGRMNAYQRQTQELQQQLAQAKQAGQNPANSGMSNTEWDTLKEDYPDIAKGIEQQQKAMESRYEQQIQQMQQQMQPLQQAQQEQYQQIQLQTLGNAHPDWQDIVKTDEYSQWLNAQPVEVQGYMGRQDAESNIYLLNLYKAMTGQSAQPQQNQLQQKRDKQLQQSKTVSSRSSVQQRGALSEDDEDALFDHFASKIDRR